MHRSRLAGFIIDCKDADVDRAAGFWSAALGMPLGEREGDKYIKLDASARDLQVEVQRVSHDSRVHLDIESDDVEAEVARLQKLGARRLEDIKTWVVLEAPTGQRFCVIRAKSPLEGKPDAQVWK
jgi:catechol 2,3-dioxygenase-like lactoylglutathione lyase family enzyme